MNPRQRPFAERLLDRCREVRSHLIVGIDPVWELLPAEFRGASVEAALVKFSSDVIEAVRPFVVGVKIQMAFFERHGWRGWRAFEEAAKTAQRAGLLVIADGKRGDIGSTARALAEGLLGEREGTAGPYIDALTVNPYLGWDGVEPFVDQAHRAHRGIFLLARTSNPGSGAIQDRPGAAEPLYLAVARAAAKRGQGLVGDSGYGPIGLVAGATYPEAVAAIREAARHSLLLLPGVGVQGGNLDGVRSAFAADGSGAVVAVSRSVTFPARRSRKSAEPRESWRLAVSQAAREYAAAIEAAIDSRDA